MSSATSYQQMRDLVEALLPEVWQDVGNAFTRAMRRQRYNDWCRLSLYPPPWLDYGEEP